MKVFVIFIGIVYGLTLIPSIKTAIAFWLYKDKSEVAKFSMRHGFIIGFLSIWMIYPYYIIKNNL